MGPIACLFDTDARSNLVRADVLYQDGLNIIRKSNMLEIQSVSDTILVVYRSIYLHLCMGE